jgi:hypothetical protein
MQHATQEHVGGAAKPLAQQFAGSLGHRVHGGELHIADAFSFSLGLGTADGAGGNVDTQHLREQRGQPARVGSIAAAYVDHRQGRVKVLLDGCQVAQALGLGGGVPQHLAVLACAGDAGPIVFPRMMGIFRHT